MHGLYGLTHISSHMVFAAPQAIKLPSMTPPGPQSTSNHYSIVHVLELGFSVDEIVVVVGALELESLAGVMLEQGADEVAHYEKVRVVSLGTTRLAFRARLAPLVFRSPHFRGLRFVVSKSLEDLAPTTRARYVRKTQTALDD